MEIRKFEINLIAVGVEKIDVASGVGVSGIEEWGFRLFDARADWHWVFLSL